MLEPNIGGMGMQGFMTTKEAAEKWGITVRQVQNHCKSGRIEGLQRVGTNYLIPIDALKPTYAFIYSKSVDEKNVK